MTLLSAVPKRQRPKGNARSAAELEALLAVLEQVRQVRADQREALNWLAEHADRGGAT